MPDVFVANVGPPLGHLLYGTVPPAIGVLRPGSSLPVGVAYVVEAVRGRRGPLAVFTLDVEGIDPATRWIVIDRQFVALGEAAE